MLTLVDKLNNRLATIGIIGLGYVGLPLALCFAKANYKVIGYDLDNKKIDSLCKGQSYIKHINSADIQEAVDKSFVPTSQLSDIASADALILCVPTPLNKYREPDLSYVIDTVESLKPYYHKGQIISLESTTYPGTTEEELLPRIESCGFTVGEDIFLVFSPEREDPGNQHFTTQTTPKVCGGHTPKCLEAGIALYQQVIDHVVPVSSTRTAELTKLLENIHRAVNIGLVNEMKIIADKMDIDIHEVIRAAATKPFGFTPYYPGPGLGGHCIPVDPFYLTWKAREYGVNAKFIELAGEINTAMPDFVVSKAILALNSVGKSINHSKIIVLGLSYKKNIDDTRESPSIHLIEKLIELGADVCYSDPYIPSYTITTKHTTQLLNSIEFSAENIAEADLILLATNHDDFDYALISDRAQLIVDTRGMFLEQSPKIFKA